MQAVVIVCVSLKHKAVNNVQANVQSHHFVNAILNATSRFDKHLNLECLVLGHN